MSEKNFRPAISIVIPLYNAEKYIGDCLESIRAQTFQDFEIVVVDDSSTDESCRAVESYTEKFSCRLKLIRLKKNSGSPGKPTNTGIKNSVGEYVLVLDNDDAITKTALEKFYRAAKKFDADIVTCENFYEVPDKIWDTFDEKNFNPTNYNPVEQITEPTPVSDDPAQRVRELQTGRFLWPLWSKLIRRKFILENRLEMAEGITGDLLFTCCAICAAEKIVRIPGAVNIYRVLDDSISHKRENVTEILNRRIDMLKKAFRYLDKFFAGQKNFRDRPDLRYGVADISVMDCCYYLSDIYAKIPAYRFDEIVRKKFPGENSGLTAFIFNRMNVFRLQLQNKN